MNISTKLIPTQSTLLRTAARRSEGRIRIPDTLRGGARSKVLAALLARGWIGPAGDRHVLSDEGYSVKAVVKAKMSGKLSTFPLCRSGEFYSRHPQRCRPEPRATGEFRARKRARKLSEPFNLVEVARIELASGRPLQSGLHA